MHLRLSCQIPELGTPASPAAGTTDGGTGVVVPGRRLGRCTGLDIGGACGSFVANDASVSGTTPAHAAGDVVIAAANDRAPGGIATGPTFTFVEPAPPAPTLDSASPAEGSAAGGTAVTLTGTGFLDATDVIFASASGWHSATLFTVVDDTTITCSSPYSGSAGSYTGSVEVVANTGYSNPITWNWTAS